MSEQPGLPDGPTAKGIEELQNELWDAGETIGALEQARDTLTVERDKARLELQRRREQASVELAEAKVAHARLQRAHNELVLKANRLEAEVGTLRLEVYQLKAGKGEFLHALMEMMQAYEETSEA